MNPKENLAIHRLFDLLESRYAMRVLWSLRDGHAQTFRLLQDSVGGITPNTLNTRLKALREAGLVEHTSEGYMATEAGRDLLKRLNDLHAFAGRWVHTLPGATPPAAARRSSAAARRTSR